MIGNTPWQFIVKCVESNNTDTLSLGNSVLLTGLCNHQGQPFKMDTHNGCSTGLPQEAGIRLAYLGTLVVLQPESLASKVLLKWKVVGSILAQHHELFLTGTCTTNLVVFCLRNGYAYESHFVNEWIGSNSK